KPHDAVRTSHLGDCRAVVPASALGPDLTLRLHYRGEELPVPAAWLHDEMVRGRLVAAARHLAAALSLARSCRDCDLPGAHLRNACCGSSLARQVLWPRDDLVAVRAAHRASR